MKLSIRSIVTLGLLLWSSTLAAAPVGTTFTYQGRLEQNGEPAEGLFDLQLTLFDAPSGGAQIDSPLLLEEVPVSEGIFTVELDFGAVFTTETALWLEAAVRPGDSEDPHVPLAPRQALRPTPLALTAAAADDARRLGGLEAEDFLQTTGGDLQGDLRLDGAQLDFLTGGNPQGRVAPEAGGLKVSALAGGPIQLDGPVYSLQSLGVGVESPIQMLEVDGAIGLGNTAQSTQGSIRWTGTDFEGFDGSNWLSLTSGSDGEFVDLSSNQTIGGGKTFSSRVTADGGLLSLGTLQVGNSLESESIDVNTSGTAIRFLRVGGSQFGEVRTNSSNDFILQANNGLLRTQGDLHLQFSSTSSFRNLFAGDINVHDDINFRDDDGITRGRLSSNGNNVEFFDGTGNGFFVVRDRLQVTGDSDDVYLVLSPAGEEFITFTEGQSVARDLDINLGSATDGTLGVNGSLDIEDHLEIGGTLTFSTIPSGQNDGEVCFDSTVFGDILIRCSSSAQYKTNISSLHTGLEVIEQLRPVQFEWSSEGTEDLGFIAEEVAEIVPALATYKAGRIDGVKYNGMTAVLVSAIQEQQKQIESLRILLCRDHPGISECQ